MTITILRRPVRTPFAAILLCGGLSVFTLTQDVTAQAPSSRAGRSLTLQVLLDRAGFSPGEIDGGVGQNTRKAIEAFQAAHELQPTGEADDATWKALGGAAADDVLVLYTITSEDVEGPFVEHIPLGIVPGEDLHSGQRSTMCARKAHIGVARTVPKTVPRRPQKRAIQDQG